MFYLFNYINKENVLKHHECTKSKIALGYRPNKSEPKTKGTKILNSL